MIAIHTKYLGPTNKRGSRVKAYTANGHQLTIESDPRLSAFKSQQAVAIALVRKLSWEPCTLVDGSTKEGFVFICLEYAEPYAVVKESE